MNDQTKEAALIALSIISKRKPPSSLTSEQTALLGFKRDAFGPMHDTVVERCKLIVAEAMAGNEVKPLELPGVE